MSKTTKIILGILAAGLIISFGIIRMNGREYQVKTVSYQDENREQYCYRGVGSIATTSVGGVINGCYLYNCDGVELGYYETATDPSAGCGGSEQYQFECLVDNCAAGTLGTSPLTEAEKEKGKNSETTSVLQKNR